MREIKFRVWDTKSESMEYEIAIGKGYGEDSFILFLGLGETFIIDDDIVKIMQYTGLKDKNSVEIYEGDIVKNVCSKVSEIIFNEDYSKYEAFEEDFSWVVSDTFEVVGNIYETPELLENNK